VNKEILPSVSNLGTEIVFGDIDADLIKSYVAQEEYIVVTSPSHIKNGNIKRLTTAIQREPVLMIQDTPSNPTEEYFQKRIDDLPKVTAQLVIAFGGGSCLDSGKVFARIFANRDIPIFLNLLNEKDELALHRSMPLIAIPTTAGTGSEVTPFATVWSFKKGTKKSLAGNDVVPKTALVFPALCASAPKDVLISSAFDALSHGLDSIWNKNATKESREFSFKAVEIISNLLSEVDFNSLTETQMEQLSLGSLYAGLAISTTRTSLSHSISYPLTYRYGIAHGTACAFSLPAIIEFTTKEGLIFPVKNLPILSKPVLYFRRIFEAHGIRDTILSSIKNSNEILQMAQEMNHPGRADNFELPLSQEQFYGIIERSIEVIYS
jgi:alcohol dehydrogenase